MIKKELSREQFNDLLISSICDMNKFNDLVSQLGLTVKPLIGYEYYIDGEFICSTEDLCVDDLVEKAGFEIQD